MAPGEESARGILGTDDIETEPLPVMGGFIIFDADEQKTADNGKRNKAATSLLGAPVFGDALIIPAGYVLRNKN